MRTISEINTRLNQLKSRQKDGVDVSEEITPLEWYNEGYSKDPLNVRKLPHPEVISIKYYIKECIDNDQYKRAESGLWLLTK